MNFDTQIVVSFLSVDFIAYMLYAHKEIKIAVKRMEEYISRRR
jgi:hypothetical protein